MHSGENASTVMAFFAKDKPATGNGWARLTDAYAASGRTADALSASREAWASSDLSDNDARAIWARYGASFTRADHDRRIDSLLFDKKPDEASRFLPYASPERQAAFGARIAMQQDSSDAETQYRAVMSSVTTRCGPDDGSCPLPARSSLRRCGRRPRRPQSPLHLQAGGSGALLRHAAPACRRRGERPPMG